MITVSFVVGITIGLLMGLIAGSAGTIVGLRLLHLMKMRKIQNKKMEENIAFRDINFLNTKIKDAG
ncbi:MAG: hypothetical protein GX660_20280 [Clostridiaceae bacterium]|nr:hypothetical protein [Clostridiaceae bacterium]